MKNSYGVSRKNILLCAAAITFLVSEENMVSQTAQYDVTVVGSVCFADGIGRQSIGLIQCLQDKMRVNFIHTRAVHDLNLKDITPEVKQIVTSKKKGRCNVAILEDVLSNGNVISPEYYYEKVPWDSHIKLAYTMFESTAIPLEWSDILNSHFDAVVVPDLFLVDVYKNSGVTIPIFVVPLGVYLDEMLKIPLKQKANYPFTFGFSGAFTDRKNHMAVLESFAAAFGNSPDVRLRLHGRGGSELYEKITCRVRELGLTNVEVSLSSFTWQEYLAFMQSLDCYISLAKGEGFAIPPREAMAGGIPVIIADHTAHKTICESGFVVAIESVSEMPAYYDHLKKFIGSNFNCSCEDAMLKMRDVYENYAFYIERASQARAWVEQYLYKNMASQFVTLIKPQRVVLGQVNKVDGNTLVTNSYDLYAKYTSMLSISEEPERLDEALKDELHELEPVTFETLNPEDVKISDADIVGAYRVMTGMPIPVNEYLQFKKFKDIYHWSLTQLAHHLLAMMVVQEHLKIPSLDSVKDFPILLHNGMTLFGYESDVFIAQSILEHRYWEPELEKLMRKIIRPGDCALDIGANIGYFTAILAECVGVNGRVYAIEALSYLSKLIKKAQNFNNWNQVVVCPCLLSNSFESVFFLMNSINPGGSCIISPAEAQVKIRIRPQSVIRMSTITLDHLMLKQQGVSRIDYIKMDVEGAEHLVLQGAETVLDRFHPKITMEFSPLRYREQGVDPVSVLRLLMSKGYHFDTVTNLLDKEDPCDYLLNFSREPEEFMIWLDEQKLGYVDIFLMPIHG